MSSIVGEIDDESDEPVLSVWRRKDGALDIKAATDLRRVCSVLGLDWSPDLEVTTLGGLVTELLGHIPSVGDTLEWRGYRLKVLAASDRRAELVRISSADQPETE